MDGTGPQPDCQLAGVPATSDSRAQSVHQSKYWNGSAVLRSHSRYSNSEAGAQFFRQCLWDQVEELVIFALPFPKGVHSFHIRWDIARVFFPPANGATNYCE